MVNWENKKRGLQSRAFCFAKVGFWLESNRLHLRRRRAAAKHKGYDDTYPWKHTIRMAHFDFLGLITHWRLHYYFQDIFILELGYGRFK